MFRAIKDTNTGVVYDWYKLNKDGTESHFNVPSELWKVEKDWSVEELEAHFGVEVSDQITDATTAPEITDTTSDEPSFL